MQFKRNIRILRHRNHLSQEKMAEKCNVSRSTITKWENGSVPDIYMIDNIAKIFDITIDELINGNLDDISGNEKKFQKQIDELKEAVSKMFESSNLDLYEEYLNIRHQNGNIELTADAYECFGTEAADKGDYQKAIQYFEASLINGNIHAVEPIMMLYDEISEFYAYQDKKEEYIYWKMTMARKMQQYGKILEEEIPRKNWN